MSPVKQGRNDCRAYRADGNSIRAEKEKLVGTKEEYFVGTGTRTFKEKTRKKCYPSVSYRFIHLVLRGL